MTNVLSSSNLNEFNSLTVSQHPNFRKKNTVFLLKGHHWLVVDFNPSEKYEFVSSDFEILWKHTWKNKTSSEPPTKSGKEKGNLHQPDQVSLTMLRGAVLSCRKATFRSKDSEGSLVLPVLLHDVE